MKLYRKDVMTILKILKHQWDTMLDMEEQNYENNKKYMALQQELFHEKWKFRYVARRLKEVAPHEAISEEELNEQIKAKQN
jgi:hypothetical protein|tara:strand:- start:862 stop:1104 length:243 start_codon:yes stop_codon:yes gene_type:complete